MQYSDRESEKSKCEKIFINLAIFFDQRFFQRVFSFNSNFFCENVFPQSFWLSIECSDALFSV